MNLIKGILDSIKGIFCLIGIGVRLLLREVFVSKERSGSKRPERIYTREELFRILDHEERIPELEDDVSKLEKKK